MSRKEEIIAMLKDTFIIFAITLVTGLLLGVVYQITKEPIAKQETQAKADACNEVFTGNSEGLLVANDMKLVFSELENVEMNQLNAKLEEQGYKGAVIDELYLASENNGDAYGYVIGVISKEGYGGNINFYMGVTMDGTCKGVSLLSISETPGLGMEADKVLIGQFADKQAESFVVTKTGATAANEIDAISSATITSKAITNGVNIGLAAFRTLQEGGSAQ